MTQKFKKKLTKIYHKQSKVPQKYLTLKLDKNKLDSKVINIIEDFSKSAGVYPKVFIDLGSIELVDKLAINLLEYLLYDLVNNKGKEVIIDYNFSSASITTQIYKTSPLMYLKIRSPYYDLEKFKKEFKYKTSIDKEKLSVHFRKMFDSSRKGAYLSLIGDDIYNSFPSFVSNQKRQLVSDLIAELVGNSIEHASSDCILDLDITKKNYVKKNEDPNKTYFGINIAVFNKSDTLIYQQIKDKVINNKGDIKGRNKHRYLYLYEAYINQKEYFNNKYTDSSFWTLSALQDKISGRVDKGDAGGTGLTKLVETLQETSDANNCYLLSGNDILFLQTDYLPQDTDWIGFNKNNNLNELPDLDNFEKIGYKFKGTAYNLSFVMEG